LLNQIIYSQKRNIQIHDIDNQPKKLCILL
jgi:hypothetical protein